MEEKFYHPDIHVSTPAEEGRRKKIRRRGGRIPGLWKKNLRKIFSRKDVKQLWSISAAWSNIRSNTQFSAMYVKFVFSNVIRELFSGESFLPESTGWIGGGSSVWLFSIQEIIRGYRKKYPPVLRSSGPFHERIRDEVAAVKIYIYNHYAEDLESGKHWTDRKKVVSFFRLSQLLFFKKETGMT